MAVIRRGRIRNRYESVDDFIPTNPTERLLKTLMKFERGGELNDRDVSIIVDTIKDYDEAIKTDAGLPVYIGYADFECAAHGATNAYKFIDCTNRKSLHGNIYIVPDGVVYIDQSDQREDKELGYNASSVRSRDAVEALSRLFGVEPPSTGEVDPNELFDLVWAVADGKFRLRTMPPPHARIRCRVYWHAAADPIIIHCKDPNKDYEAYAVATMTDAAVITPHGVYKYGKDVGTSLFGIFHIEH